MPCPKCKGILMFEDGVTFCEDCLFVLERKNDIPSKRKAGRPFGTKVRFAQIEKMKSKIWKPGERLVIHLKDKKTDICISKKGFVYYMKKQKSKHHK